MWLNAYIVAEHVQCTLGCQVSWQVEKGIGIGCSREFVAGHPIGRLCNFVRAPPRLSQWFWGCMEGSGWCGMVDFICGVPELAVFGIVIPVRSMWFWRGCGFACGRGKWSGGLWIAGVCDFAVAGDRGCFFDVWYTRHIWCRGIFEGYDGPANIGKCIRTWICEGTVPLNDGIREVTFSLLWLDLVYVQDLVFWRPYHHGNISNRQTLDKDLSFIV